MEMRSTNDLIEAANADTETDDFEKLKAEREKERLERQKQKFARQISTAPGTDNAAAPTIVPVVAAAIIPAAPATSTAETQNGTQSVVSASTIPTTGSNADLLSITEPVTHSTQKFNEQGFNE